MLTLKKDTIDPRKSLISNIEKKTAHKEVDELRVQEEEVHRQCQPILPPSVY